MLADARKELAIEAANKLIEVSPLANKSHFSESAFWVTFTQEKRKQAIHRLMLAIKRPMVPLTRSHAQSFLTHLHAEVTNRHTLTLRYRGYSNRRTLRSLLRSWANVTTDERALRKAMQIRRETVLIKRLSPLLTQKWWRRWKSRKEVIVLVESQIECKEVLLVQDRKETGVTQEVAQFKFFSSMDKENVGNLEVACAINGRSKVANSQIRRAPPISVSDVGVSVRQEHTPQTPSLIESVKAARIASLWRSQAVKPEAALEQRAAAQAAIRLARRQQQAELVAMRTEHSLAVAFTKALTAADLWRRQSREAKVLQTKSAMAELHHTKRLFKAGALGFWKWLQHRRGREAAVAKRFDLRRSAEVITRWLLKTRTTLAFCDVIATKGLLRRTLRLLDVTAFQRAVAKLDAARAVWKSGVKRRCLTRWWTVFGDIIEEEKVLDDSVNKVVGIRLKRDSLKGWCDVTDDVKLQKLRAIKEQELWEAARRLLG
jgi:hypothetical protein